MRIKAARAPRRYRGGMEIAIPTTPRVSVSLWRDTVAPKEHGSWSLAFEPIVLALAVAPSWPGALFGVALAAGFFARRPLRIALRERDGERRVLAWRALGGCSAIAMTCLGGAVVLGGTAWLAWLLPMAIAAGIFSYCDLHGAGREEVAEIAGAGAFALAPAAFAALAGWTPWAALALAVVMLGRAVPAVLCVRAFLRAAKTGVRRDAPALLAAVAAVAVTTVLFDRELAPFAAVVAMVVFAARALALLTFVRPAWRARSVGMIEGVLGLAFIICVAGAWR